MRLRFKGEASKGFFPLLMSPSLSTFLTFAEQTFLSAVTYFLTSFPILRQKGSRLFEVAFPAFFTFICTLYVGNSVQIEKPPTTCMQGGDGWFSFSRKFVSRPPISHKKRRESWAVGFGKWYIDRRNVTSSLSLLSSLLSSALRNCPAYKKRKEERGP